MAVLTVGFEWDDASMNLHHNEFAKNPQSNNIGPKIFNDSTVCISYLFNFKSNKKIKILKGFIKLIYYISLFFFSVKQVIIWIHISPLSNMKDILCFKWIENLIREDPNKSSSLDMPIYSLSSGVVHNPITSTSIQYTYIYK